MLHEITSLDNRLIFWTAPYQMLAIIWIKLAMRYGTEDGGRERIYQRSLRNAHTAKNIFLSCPVRYVWAIQRRPESEEAVDRDPNILNGTGAPQRKASDMTVSTVKTDWRQRSPNIA